MPGRLTNEKIKHGVGIQGLGSRASIGGCIIYVNEDQLDQVQYLLYQSSLGNHILFNNDTIKRIAPSSEIEPESEEDKIRLENAERLLEELILCPSLDAKLMFLERLDPGTYDEVARVYLKIVENAASEDAYRH